VEGPLLRLLISCKNNTISFNCTEVLADRIAVGCTLNRGEYNLACNEVMLSDSDDSVSYILHHIFIINRHYIKA
jgi:hypothetical protein